jgi:hypothetical protein
VRPQAAQEGSGAVVSNWTVLPGPLRRLNRSVQTMYILSMYNVRAMRSLFAIECWPMPRFRVFPLGPLVIPRFNRFPSFSLPEPVSIP